MNYKLIFKKNGISLTEFAKTAGLSRPTVYKYLKMYSDGKSLSEPYQSVFDAFFMEERSEMQNQYVCVNGNLLVRLIENTSVNPNGTIIRGAETRGKKDIVIGEIVASTNNFLPEGTEVYFSFYAAQAVTLEDEQLYIVNKEDLKFYKKGTKK
jgi:co-chaperonin GroES (HSP10)